MTAQISDTKTSGSDIRVGMIGCGNIARAHAGIIKDLPGVRVAVVYDPRREAAQAMAEQTGATVADSIEAMTDRAALDAVVLCTPPGGRAEVCLPIIEAGLAILCEKPLEITAQAARTIADAVDRAGTVFQIGFCHRFHGPIIELRRLIDSGRLGRPLFMRNIFAGYLDITSNHRSNPAVAGGGCLIDNGTHAIDLFRHLVDEPVHVQTMGGTILQQTPVEDIAMMNVATDGGAFGEMTNSFSIRFPGNWIEWYGTEGSAIVSYANPGHPDLAVRMIGDDAWTEVDVAAHPPRFKGQWQHFLTALRGEAQALPSVHDALRASEIIEAAYTAMNTGHRQPCAPTVAQTV